MKKKNMKKATALGLCAVLSSSVVVGSMSVFANENIDEVTTSVNATAGVEENKDVTTVDAVANGEVVEHTPEAHASQEHKVICPLLVKDGDTIPKGSDSSKYIGDHYCEHGCTLWDPIKDVSSNLNNEDGSGYATIAVEYYQQDYGDGIVHKGYASARVKLEGEVEPEKKEYYVGIHSPSADVTLDGGNQMVLEGTEVGFTISNVAENRVVSGIELKDEYGSNVPLTDDGNNHYTFTMPSSNVNITVLFDVVDTEPEQEYFGVELDKEYPEIDNVEFICVGDVNEDGYKAGSRVDVNFYLKDGYVLDGVTTNVDGLDLVKKGENQYSFTMPKQDVKVIPTISNVGHEFNIKVNSSTNGKVTCKGKAKAGEKVTVEVTPDEGYELVKLNMVPFDTGIPVDITKELSFTMPESEVLLSATFRKAQPSENHSVTVEPTTNGSVSVDKTSAKAGEFVTVTTKADKGYELDTLTVLEADGTNIPVVDGKFVMPNTDVRVSATFRATKPPVEEDFAVTIENSENGKITSDKAKYKAGDLVTLAIAPNSGYMLDTLTVYDSKDGFVEVNVVDEETSTFVMPEGGARVVGTFREIPQEDSKVEVTFLDIDKNLKIEPMNSEGFYFNEVEGKWYGVVGKTAKIKVTANNPNFELGYLVITENIAGGSAIEYTDLGDGVYSFVVPANPVVVNGVSKPVSRFYDVNVEPTANGTVTPSTLKAEAGERVDLEITANEGYEVKSIKVVSAEGETIEVIGNSFVMPNSNVTVTVEFEAVEVPPVDEFTATVSSDGNGSVWFVDKDGADLGQTIKAKAGETVYVANRPNDGYKFRKITVINLATGEEIPTNLGSFTMPEGNVEIKVEFVKESIGSVWIDRDIIGGTVTTDKDVANAGETVKITATAKDGYKFVRFDVMTDGGKAVEVSADGIFVMPEGNVLVSAIFEKDEDTSIPWEDLTPAQPIDPENPDGSIPATPINPSTPVDNGNKGDGNVSKPSEDKKPAVPATSDNFLSLLFASLGISLTGIITLTRKKFKNK